MVGDPVVRAGEPGVAAGRRGEMAQRPVQDDVLGAAVLGSLAAGDGGEFAVVRAACGVQAAYGVTEVAIGFAAAAGSVNGSSGTVGDGGQ